MAKIKNTGELREFLSNMLMGIKEGVIDGEKARNMTKMAAQINESFYAKIKIAKVRMEAGQALAELGSLPLNKAE